ncbi:response regulator receiver sensor signal transduction histidine kinase [Flammeovirgaceae bacterium 311]|nr:response regulator receiver sensor signal transduction histidine kinase [Flammeovirgaceae bacterium 311]
MSLSRILIVEDEGIAALSLKETLESLGFGVTGLAANGQEALAAVQDTLPDLVLMDIHLEEKEEGIALGRQLMEEYALPVVFLTAYADPDTLAKAKEIFPYGYMVKPYREADLLVSIETAVYKHLADKREKQLNNTKNKLYSLIAHDLRSPLAALKLATRTLLKRRPSMSAEDVDDMITDIHHTVDNLYNFADNLLDWARIHSDRIRVRPEAVVLQPLVQEVLEMLQAKAMESKISLHTTIDPDLLVWADRTMLRSMLLNLTSNSLKFTAAGGTIDVKASQQQQQVVVTVTDTGIGMSRYQLDSLLVNRMENPTPGLQEEKGTGLGLLLTKEFVSLNGGTMEINSSPGKGTTIAISLLVPDAV